MRKTVRVGRWVNESMRSSREPRSVRRAPVLGLALVALLGLSGCNSLRARFRAREGADLYHAGEYAGAAAKFDEASKLDPSLPVLLLNNGTSNLAQFRAVGGKSDEG